MHKTVLVPLDGSPAGETALPWAVEIARARHYSLTLVQVVSWPPLAPCPDPLTYGSPEQYTRLLSDLRQNATDYLDEVCRRLPAAGVAVSTAVGQGRTVEGILRLADEYAAAVIVMARYDHGALHRLLLGSVAARVLHQASVPVLLFPAQPMPRPAMRRRLLVPLDGSAFGESALELARELAGPDTTLVLADIARVVMPPLASDSTGTLDITAPEYADAATDSNVSAARWYLDSVARNLKLDGIGVESWTRLGSVWREILAVAREADVDLIVMASHERSGPSRWVHGSVVGAVAWHADVPVLVAGRRALVERAIGSPLVGDIVGPPTPLLHEADSLGMAVRLLDRCGIDAAPVVDAAGILVGLLAAADVVAWEAQLVGRLANEPAPSAASYVDHLAQETVGTIMERPAATVEAGTPLIDAVDLLRQQHASSLVVTEFGRPVGLLTGTDVIHAMAPASARAGLNDAEWSVPA